MGSGKYIYLEGGDTAHTLLGWGHRTYFVNGVGTPHNIERTRFSTFLRIQDGFPTDAVVWWVGGWFSCII